MGSSTKNKRDHTFMFNHPHSHLIHVLVLRFISISAANHQSFPPSPTFSGAMWTDPTQNPHVLTNEINEAPAHPAHALIRPVSASIVSSPCFPSKTNVSPSTESTLWKPNLRVCISHSSVHYFIKLQIARRASKWSYRSDQKTLIQQIEKITCIKILTNLR